MPVEEEVEMRVKERVREEEKGRAAVSPRSKNTLAQDLRFCRPKWRIDFDIKLKSNKALPADMEERMKNRRRERSLTTRTMTGSGRKDTSGQSERP